ncbi:Methylmalonic aciduria type A protein, mitochondrial-like [Oopsacas minuta]|uniref:Methylmalonic aciduria type A protein, mitochondrial-like n=1 Tax=Oopsacas minuta TaxID=111878 RepID=A0AAV7KF79_9METZ|nr:Methylmalonic aciduria type A protein, mitochondrial-like [Oopsacas minuta]
MIAVRKLFQTGPLLVRCFTNIHSFFQNELRQSDRDRVNTLFDGIIGKDRRFLSEGITLIESRSPRKQMQANLLLSLLQDHLNIRDLSMRIGLSGPPGAGKSTFIDSLGMHLVNQGHRVAVLAVDPSSQQTLGALLGDKTRMARLSKHPNAYIRPSPSSGTLGGVTATSHSAITLCEAAGYDVILVETVGAGQSDVAVSQITDCFVLVLPPGGGDDLQGLKKGIMEMADIIVVNKADGQLLPAARKLKSEYLAALKILKPKLSSWKPPSLLVSSKEDRGVDTVWGRVLEFWELIGQDSWLEQKRGEQRINLMQSHLHQYLSELITSSQLLQEQTRRMSADVSTSRLPPSAAAFNIVQWFLKYIESNNKLPS